VTGQFSLVHSYIVFQHIPPKRGLKVLTDLASRVERGGMIVLQLPYYRDSSALRKLATIVKRKDPLINTLAKPGRPPTIQLSDHDDVLLRHPGRPADLVQGRLQRYPTGTG